jgi:hypothetical protein
VGKTLKRIVIGLILASAVFMTGKASSTDTPNLTAAPASWGAVSI